MRIQVHKCVPCPLIYKYAATLLSLIKSVYWVFLYLRFCHIKRLMHIFTLYILVYFEVSKELNFRGQHKFLVLAVWGRCMIHKNWHLEKSYILICKKLDSTFTGN